MKPRRDYSWRYAKAASGSLVRDAQRNERRDDVLWRLHQIGPRHVYRQLLSYARVHKKSEGWMRANLWEIFGAKPPLVCSVESLPDFYIIEEWIAFR